MKKILVIVVLVTLGTGGYYFISKKENATTIKYKDAVVSFEELTEYVETTGEVVPLNRVEIQPSAGGRVEKILIEEGEKVKKGQVLAFMSSTDRVAILDAAYSMGEEEYKYWQDAYKPIKIIAPLNGTIILKNVVEGQTVNQNSVLFAVSDKLIVMASVDESDIGKVKLGQKAFITLDAYPDKRIYGKVFQILDEGKNVNNVIIYKVRIMPHNVPAFFKSQMTANIKIEVSGFKKSLVLPSEAIVMDASGKPSVIIGIKDKKPVYKNIITGVEIDSKTEILQGLSEGTRVLYAEATYSPQKKDEGTTPFLPSKLGLSGNKQKMPRGVRRVLPH